MSDPKRPEGQSILLGDSKREVAIAIVLTLIATGAATIEYGQEMGVAVLAVVVALAVHVRFYLGVLLVVQRLRSGIARREAITCVALLLVATVLHWVSPVPLGKVAAFSGLVAVVVFWATGALRRGRGVTG